MKIQQKKIHIFKLQLFTWNLPQPHFINVIARATASHTLPTSHPHTSLTWEPLESFEGKGLLPLWDVAACVWVSSPIAPPRDLWDKSPVHGGHTATEWRVKESTGRRKTKKEWEPRGGGRMAMQGEGNVNLRPRSKNLITRFFSFPLTLRDDNMDERKTEGEVKEGASRRKEKRRV